MTSETSVGVPDLGKVVVLLVDDQLIIGEAVRRILVGHPGIEFHYCQKGQDALATAARLLPTVILQDLVMPDADGLELVRGYRGQQSTAITPIVVLSSKEEGATKAEAFARGANDYIVKLPDPVELIARVRYHSRGYLSLLQRNQAFEDLRRSQAALAAELAQAEAYVRKLLPAPVEAPVKIDWLFVPSASLGGDCFDYFWIDDDHMVIYLLDVCGHGVGPALLSVSARNTVRAGGVGSLDPRDPTTVAASLNAAFPMDKHGNMFFTLWYGVYQKSTRTLRYTGGGHPPSILFLPGSATPAAGSDAVRMLETPGPPIGIAAGMEFETITTDVPLGSTLLIYSDGAFEVFTAEGKIWGVDGLLKFMQSRDLRSPECLHELHQIVKSMTGSDVLGDDFSILLASFRE